MIRSRIVANTSDNASACTIYIYVVCNYVCMRVFVCVCVSVCLAAHFCSGPRACVYMLVQMSVVEGEVARLRALKR